MIINNINNMKNTIRYSKLPRYAYGTKKLPKFGAGTDLYNSEAYNDANSTYMNQLQSSEQNKQKSRNKDQTSGVGDMIGAGAETYLNSTPYYGIASTAANTAKSALGKKQTINPVTGEVTSGFASQDDAQMNELFTPVHTQVIDDAKKGDYMSALGDMAMLGTVIKAAKGSKEFDSAKAANDKLTAGIKEQQLNEKNAYESKQRDAYSRAYMGVHSANGDSGASVYKYGTALPKYNLGSEATAGGIIQPLASNVKKAIGDTHDQDSDNDGQSGITLQDNNGNPKAEIENQEVIVDNNKVLSNRLPFTGGRTFADMGEKLGKDKAKNEDKLKTGDMFAKNTAKLNLRNIDSKMNKLFQYQDIVRNHLGISAEQPVKMAYGGFVPSSGIENDENNPLGYRPKTQFEANKMYQMEVNRANYSNMSNRDVASRGNVDLSNRQNVPQIEKGSITPYEESTNTTTNTIPTTSNNKTINKSKYLEMLGNATPYIDNAVNAQLIKQTPNIPSPVKRINLDEVAMPIKTSFNINPQLAANTQDLREYNANILNNTASSNDARAYLTKGLSSKLQNNNALYGQKENTETQLSNQDSLNRQGVNNRNIGNRQNILNENNGLTDKYNWDNMLRSDDIRRQKSILTKETTDDMMYGIQDKRTSKLDNDKIMLDSTKYSDGAGLASLMGTNQMDKLSETKEGRAKIRDTFKKSGRSNLIATYNKKYGVDE